LLREKFQNPHTAEELKENIRPVISGITQSMLRRIFRNVLMKCEAVLRAEGRHFDHHLLF